MTNPSVPVIAEAPNGSADDVDLLATVRVQGLPMHSTAKVIAALVKRCGGQVILSDAEIEATGGLIVRAVWNPSKSWELEAE